MLNLIQRSTYRYVYVIIDLRQVHKVASYRLPVSGGLSKYRQADYRRAFRIKVLVTGIRCLGYQ
ncbi:hypothetical protein A3860_28490 [Niastella vici]|uniref:Uncharacterized protein n=1 Tax=Niastella vici TaxID=1703345 RepID=A0A1V9FVG4_9BACT|nr:hypothetical protein A3860_28490 [Niastella vici]